MLLIVEIVNGPQAGQRFWLRGNSKLTVGRSRSADYVLDDPYVSREHFMIETDDHSASLLDLGSSGGTAVNGEKVSVVVLASGDHIYLGQSTLRVIVEGVQPTDGDLDEGTLPIARNPTDIARIFANFGTSGPAGRSRDKQHTVRARPAPKFPTSTEDPERIVSTLLPGQSPSGQHILSVLLKRTYDVQPGQTCTRAEEDQPILTADKYFEDPMKSTVEFESDFVPYKLKTDVVFLGKVYAPQGKSVRSVVAAVTVGDQRKEVLVFGDRKCTYRTGRSPEIGDPEVFESIDLRYERSYGGIDVFSDPSMQYPYPRNILGRGFVIEYNRKNFDGLLLPNFEDPQDPLTADRLCTGSYEHWSKQPKPVGFGWTSKHCQPRSTLAGVMPADKLVEQELRTMYATAVPEAQRQQYLDANLPDMDFRFFNGASDGLVFDKLFGDEQIQTRHLHEDGYWDFALPGDRPRIGLDIGDGIQETEVALQTVQVRIEDAQVDLVWRGAIPYSGPEWLPEMKTMEVHVSG